MYSIILCGGSGTRLWPLSRKNYPKQFLRLYSDKSLLQETFCRLKKIMPAKNIFCVTNRDNLFNVFNQIREVEEKYNQKNIIIEPASRNTAPAITLAVRYITEKRKDSSSQVILIAPADHYISNTENFVSLVKQAAREVQNNLGIIGIVPMSPETGYGYIRKGRKWKSGFRVLEFKEKPDRPTAEKYLLSGQYLWNSGFYFFRPKFFERELFKYAPQIAKYFKQGFKSLLDHFEKLPTISIDYALAEKSRNLVVFEGNFGWSDIGSFDSLSTIKKGNSHPKHLSFDSRDVYIHSESNRLIATLGMENINIIETTDCLLIHRRGRAEEVKKIVEHIQQKNMPELEHNLIVHRPWGKYEVLLSNPCLKVKAITVHPGSRLSLQAHRRRAERWIVVQGTATIQKGSRITRLKTNESVYIPVMTKHRLSNEGKNDLKIIEVQTGDYLEEDDIIRYEDIYKRA